MSLSRGPLVVRTLPVVALLLLYAVAASAVAERSPVQAALEDAAAQRVGPPQADQASPSAIVAARPLRWGTRPPHPPLRPRRPQRRNPARRPSADRILFSARPTRAVWTMPRA